MNTVHDNDFRHALIERFLDCDTTIEEEQALARYYRECKLKGCVPDGENEICDMVIVTVQVQCTAPVEVQDAAIHSRRATLRWLAAACVAIAVVCGAVVAFHGNADKPVIAESNKTMSHKASQSEVDTATVVVAANDAKGVAHNMEDGEETFLTHESKPARSKEPIQSISKEQSQSVSRQASSSASEITRLYDMALDTFGDATDITIERKGDVILLSAVNADGKTERYAVAMSDGEAAMLVAL